MQKTNRIIHIVVGCIFLYSGIVKSIDVTGFAESIMNYQLTDYKLSLLVASTLPYLEILVGSCLIIGVQIKPALTLVLIMMAVFICVISYALFNNIDINCGCFSTKATESNLWTTLSRDVVISFGCLISFFKMETKYVSAY
jgi:uncharacterized membrane protein YphA (DoxX/SURF4 family)